MTHRGGIGPEVRGQVQKRYMHRPVRSDGAVKEHKRGVISFSDNPDALAVSSLSRRRSGAMSLQLSRYLKDFSAPRLEAMPMTPRYFPELDDFPGQGTQVRAEPVPAIDIEGERAEAFAAGRAEAEAELEARHEAAMAELRARHDAELEALQVRCETDIAAMVAARFAAMETQLGVVVGDQVARVLAPVMDEVLTEKSVRSLAETLSTGLRSGEAATVIVKGPSALFEKLKRHLGNDDILFRHEETTDIDLSVEYGNAILVTRMAAWADAVRKVLA